MRSILTVAALAVVLAGTALAQGEVYKVGNGVRSPVLRQEVKPSYTEEAMRRKVQGIVELSATVLKDGTVGDDVIVTSSEVDERDALAPLIVVTDAVLDSLEVADAG